MAFTRLIYFYIVLLSFLINPKEVMPRKGVRESDIPSPPFRHATASASSSPAISAVLLECPNVQKRAEESRPDCERQMMVHIRVSPSFQVETLDKFLLLDEVYDQRRKTRAKLMSPYLIEISRGEPVVMYPLQFTKSIRCDTCGHKNGNNTNTIQGNCEHPVDGNGSGSGDGGLADVRLPLDVPDIHLGGEGVVATGLTGIHPSRRVQQERKHKEQHQEQHNANKAPIGNGHNPASAPATIATADAGPKPSGKIESRQKLAIAIGILDPSHFGEAKKQVNIEKGFFSRGEEDSPSTRVHQGKGIMDYDADEYDELNLSDEALTSGVDNDDEEENEFSGQNKVRDKRLKTTRPLSQSSLSSSKVVPPHDALLSRNEAELFREAERQGEEARMETIRAFTRKHVHQPVGGTVVGTSAGPNAASGTGTGTAAGDGYGAATARSLGNVEKPHVVGIQEDCIRPQGAFDADEIDDVESDVDGKAGSSRNSKGNGNGNGNGRDEGQKAVARLQLKSFLNKNEHEFGGAEMQNSQRHGAMQKSPSRLLGDKERNRSPSTSKGSMHNQKGATSNSNRKEENAFISPPPKSLPPSGSHRSMQKKQQSRQQQQKLRLQKLHDGNGDDDNDGTKDVSTIQRKFQFTDAEDDSVDTQGFDASGSDDDGGASNEDYDGIDASVRDSAVIESKSNITDPDDIDTLAGGMGDEFYYNTLHYPSSSRSRSSGNVFSKHKALGGAFDEGFKITAYDSGKFHDSLDHKTSRILARNGKKEFGQAAAARASPRNYNAHQTTSSTSKKRPDDKEEVTPLKHPKKNGSKSSRRSGGKFSDKSAIARNRMKIRGNDGSAGGVVETSGMYTAKDGVVPAFPLNGYPGYLGVKTPLSYITPDHPESQYKLLENIPQEYLPHQPAYAKEISDPNLTVNDKINLLEVLSSHDNVKDAVLRNFENDLDSSVIVHDFGNQDRMHMPSTRLSRNREKKEIQKRSYLLYDDLTMRDTDEQYDDLDKKQPFDAPLFEKETVSNSGKCELCKGNKCPSKRDGDDSCRCDRQGRHCECSPQKSEKKIRSVSDAWYSVFNMSAPLQFLTIRVGIYQKRHGTWWKTAPSITLTSLSRIYASENLSISFSSHVDIFQLRRPLNLQNHKLLVPHPENAGAHNEVIAEHPKLYESINPNDVLAIDSSKFDFNKIHDDSDTNNKKYEQNNGTSASAAAAAKRALCHALSASAELRGKQRSSHSNSASDAVLSVGDLGYCPGNMKILEQCPSDPNHLCLNMLDEKAPAFTIKIKQPFLENGLFYPVGKNTVRIASVISDATTRGAFKVAVVLINEDLVSHEYIVCICDCPMTCGARTTVKKVLPPQIGETISFLLPLEENKDTKLHCNVEPTARCLCIWDCDCYCIQDLVPLNEYHVCHKLSDYEEQAAGFIEGGVPGQEDLTGWWWFCWRMNHYAFSLLLCMLFLGLLKAILGALCLQRIDRCGYDYVQPLKKYDYASRCRRFFINIVFFVVLPFICCCKCFTPSEEDLLMASTEWQCSLIQHDLYEDSSGDGDGDGDANADGGNGNGKWKKPSGLYYENGQNANDNNVDDDEETILRLSQNFESGRRVSEMEGSQSRMTMSEYLLRTCEFDDGEEERDMDFVRRALTESRESIKMLLKSHRSEDLDVNPQAAKAEDLVRRLVAANIVYRTFEMPLHGVKVPPGQKYSIQGFFLPSVGQSYQFISTSPLLQQRQITTTSTKGNTSSLLEPPKFLREKDFQRTYSSKLNVLEAGDLSVAPPLDAPCINSSNTTNESQLTALLTSSSLPLPVSDPTPIIQPPTYSINASPITGLPPVDKFGPANDVASEHGPATANDTITRSDRVDDANNGSNLTAKQKDSTKGFE